MTQERRHLLGTTPDEFAQWCDENGLPAYRAGQVFDWVYRKNAADFASMTNLSKPLREQLAAQWDILTSAVLQKQESSDGTTKLLLRWPDEATTECVLIPDEKRRTACISSQVGCPVGCAFCASGLNGLQRQLTAGEIVEQVVQVARLVPPDLRLTNVVFMGLGEPLANYNALVKALRIINAREGLGIGARKITVSTVGLPRQIRQLARENLQISLAISLHAPNDTLRQELIPWAARVSIDELADAARYFFETTTREVTIEYVLLAGVNDRMEHAHELARICRKMRCNVNLIRYNPVPNLPFERPSATETYHFVERLRSRGINVHVRKSRGTDIDAACGQLRRRHAGQQVQAAVAAEEVVPEAEADAAAKRGESDTGPEPKPRSRRIIT